MQCSLGCLIGLIRYAGEISAFTVIMFIFAGTKICRFVILDIFVSTKICVFVTNASMDDSAFPKWRLCKEEDSFKK